jgi:hypothetical protein
MDAGVALGETLLQRTHEVGIGAGHELIHEFDDGHFAAERAVHRSHFQADDAAADDEQFLRNVGEQQRVGRIHHARVVPRKTGQLHGLRTGGDDRVPEAHEFFAVFRVDFDLVRRHERAGAGDDRDLALLAHAGEAAVHLRDDLVLVRAQLVEFDFRRAEGDADVGGVRGFVDDARGVQQRLRRNAADVEADAAERAVAFDEHDVLAEVGGAERGRVAAGAGAEHDDVAVEVGLAARIAGGFRCGRSGRCRSGGRGSSRCRRGCRFRRRRGRSGSGRSGRAFGLDDGDDAAFRNLVADLHAHFLDDAGDARRHFHRRLVRFQRDQALVLRDRLAGLDQNLDDRHALEIADVRNLDLDSAHAGILLRGERRSSRAEKSRVIQPNRRRVAMAAFCAIAATRAKRVHTDRDSTAHGQRLSSAHMRSRPCALAR